MQRILEFLSFCVQILTCYPDSHDLNEHFWELTYHVFFLVGHLKAIEVIIDSHNKKVIHNLY